MATLRVVPSEVAWLPWSADAFARARVERKPILLCIATTWSDSCREMDRTSYADPAIAFLINDRFVPVRVDADRRPDISERYSLGGWPTTAFLTPDGEILGGGTYVERARMPEVLEKVRATFDEQRGHPTFRGMEHSAIAETATARNVECPRLPVLRTSDELCAQIFASFDADFAGFGREPKFPHAAPVHLALALHQRSADEHLKEIVVRTLDAMGALYDEADGGFYRYATGRDWTRPHHEKMLDVNAALVRVHLAAAQALDIARYADRAADTLRFVLHSLADATDGGWYGSQSAAGDVVDRVFYADANAAMASAALSAAAAFEDEWLRDFALKSLERVLLACYRPGQGVAHYFDGGAHVRGLLCDQIAMADAQLDAYDATGNIVYEMMAEELAHFALREMWDPEHGGFFDRAAGDGPDALGLLRLRLKPFVTNCDAARLLKRLAAASGDDQFARASAETLAAMAPLAPAQGALAAHYVLATL
jgi:uncharacterized protein YyaL (SSP411 family)